jgi:hypothetical protein
MVTCNGLIPAERDVTSDTSQVVLSDMQFDPFNTSRRFAVGTAGAFMTTDGITWQRLLDTGAMRGLPTNCFFDQTSNPSDPSLYVGFAGRGIVKISDLGLGGGVILSTTTPTPAEPEPNRLTRSTVRVRTADGRLGRAEAGPDGILFITLDDGPSIVSAAASITILEEDPPADG